jgi:8-amino-7-oxononanoate synthase
MHKPFTISQIPNRTIEHEGQTYLFFSGTSYLGIAQHPQMQAFLAEGVAQYGLHFGSSRNGNLQLAIYEETEARLAEWAGADSALTTSSGMVAGQVVVDWLARRLTPETVVVQAPGTHPALWHPLLNAKTLPLTTAQLAETLGSTNHAPLCILTNSVDALRGLQCDFGWLPSLTDRPVWLVVDDSHGLGVINAGRGIYGELRGLANQMPTLRFVVTASLAKAMGLPGGVILGDRELMSALRQTAYFGACSPMPPAYAYAYAQAGTLHQEMHKRLMHNVALAESVLMPTGLFTHGNGYPVFYTEHTELYPALLKQGIFIYSFAYPTPHDKANTRLVISAYHEEDDIHALAAAIGSL